MEPVIGHMKQDNGMGRCWLKGAIGGECRAGCSRLQPALATAGDLEWQHQTDVVAPALAPTVGGTLGLVAGNDGCIKDVSGCLSFAGLTT